MAPERPEPEGVQHPDSAPADPLPDPLPDTKTRTDGQLAFQAPTEGPGEALDEASMGEGSSAVMRSSAIMAVGTIVSRLTGVGRDIAIVAAIGFGTLADAYTLGNTLPNTIYLLLVGGTLSAVFVPQLVRHLKSDADGGDAYANRLLTLTSLVLLAIAVASVLLAPWIVSLYVPDDYPQANYELAVAFARLCLPQIFFYGIYTMQSQVLNSRGHFGMPMFAPIANNILVIGMALAFLAVAGTSASVESITPGQVALLGIGTTLGVVVQSLILLPVLRRVNFRIRPRFDFRGSGLGKTAKLAGWTVALVLANQVALLITARLATQANVLASEQGTTPEGLMTFDKAYLVFMLPVSVITISIVTSLLPRMSEQAADGDLRAVSDQLVSGARLISALIIPCGVILVVEGPLITQLVFGYGAGAGEAAIYTGLVVSAFSIGLLPFSLFYLLIRGWYSLEDTRTPFYVTVVFNALLIVFMLAFFELAPVGGKVVSLALAESLAYWISLVVAWFWLRRKLIHMHTWGTIWALARMFLAGIVAVPLAWLATFALRSLFGAVTGVSRDLGMNGNSFLAALALVFASVVALAVYAIACRLLRVPDVDTVLRMAWAKVPFPSRRRSSAD
ncbi:MAG: murein biosynthesis integral membrane protein MurJ [Candidatus Nanopelagicales bacterium]